jgi:hypothetical protein
MSSGIVAVVTGSRKAGKIPRRNRSIRRTLPVPDLLLVYGRRGEFSNTLRLVVGYSDNNYNHDLSS